jgi:hypothetical protein
MYATVLYRMESKVFYFIFIFIFIILSCLRRHMHTFSEKKVNCDFPEDILISQYPY